ncbi:hypothetical protein [Sclerotinia sclerotiorum reovirus 1]|nr:hypothetical protein [Sclerotinia sclerotiorum reovirus 1]
MNTDQSPYAESVRDLSNMATLNTQMQANAPPDPSDPFLDTKDVKLPERRYDVEGNLIPQPFQKRKKFVTLAVLILIGIGTLFEALNPHIIPLIKTLKAETDLPSLSPNPSMGYLPNTGLLKCKCRKTQVITQSGNDICAYWLPDPAGRMENMQLSADGLDWALRGAWPDNSTTAPLVPETFENFVDQVEDIRGQDHYVNFRSSTYPRYCGQYCDYVAHGAGKGYSLEDFLIRVKRCLTSYNKGKCTPYVVSWDSDSACYHKQSCVMFGSLHVLGGKNNTRRISPYCSNGRLR